MTLRQAAATSMHEYLVRLEGAQHKERERWELARWICWHQMRLSPNIPKHSTSSTPKAFCRFPWEAPSDEELKAKAEEYRITEEEIEELNKIFASLDGAQQ